MPVVPMFHANAWGYPYLATLQGAKLVYPGPCLDADSLLEDMEQERVTWAAGVPTIWMGDPRAARRGARPVGSLRDEGHARGRLRGAARDDRRLRGAARTAHLPGLGE
jgi:Acyl-CoA synthetases (AMP-forming)/AMP-acid ligases II